MKRSINNQVCVPASQSVLGYTGIDALDELGLNYKNISYEKVNGKLNVVLVGGKIMSYFSENDLEQIELLVFNPKLKPKFDTIKFCLIWEDEKPLKLSIDGYDKLVIYGLLDHLFFIATFQRKNGD